MEQCDFLRCDKIIEAAVGIKTYLLSAPKLRVLEQLKPGRYIVIKHPDQSGAPRMRNYTITDIREDGRIEITVKNTGSGGVSDNLADTMTCGSLICMSDFGGSVTSDCVFGFRHVLMLAGGIGITLPVAIIRSLVHRHEQGEVAPKITLLVSSRTIASIPFLAELLGIDFKYDWFEVYFFITQEEISFRSLHFVSGRLDKDFLLGVVRADAAVICGSYDFSIAKLDQIKKINSEISCFIEAFSHPVCLTPAKNSKSRTLVNVQAGVNKYRFEVEADTTILEALQDNGVAIRSQCRSGICGSCKIKIIKGSCRTVPDFSLSLNDLENGYVLACCSYGEGGELSVEV